MREFQERNKVKKRVYSKTVLLGLFLFLILITKGAFSVYAKERDSREEMERILKQKQELQARLDTMNGHNELLKTEAGVEAEIRNKFDVVKQGEGVVVIVDKEIPMIEADKRGVMKKFWDSVVNVFK